MFREKFLRNGYVLLPNLLGPDLVERIAATLSKAVGPYDSDRLPLHKLVDEKRLHFPVRLEGALLEPGLWAHPVLEFLLNTLLGPEYLIDNFTLVVAMPGAPEMHLHRDFPPLFPNEVPTETLPVYAVSMIVPLIATDEYTGTTRLAADSMASEIVDGELVPPPREWVDPHVPLGGAVLMDYRLWHRGAANRSDRPRPVLYLNFTRDWFTDSRNYELHPRMIVDRAAMAAIPAEHRHRFRRAAAPGLIDATVKELDAKWRKREAIAAESSSP